MIISKKLIAIAFNSLLITSLITGSAFAQQEHHDKHDKKQSEATRLIKFCVGAACIGGSAFSLNKANDYFTVLRLINSGNKLVGGLYNVFNRHYSTPYEIEQAKLEVGLKSAGFALSGLVLGSVGLGLVISSMRS